MILNHKYLLYLSIYFVHEDVTLSVCFLYIIPLNVKKVKLKVVIFVIGLFGFNVIRLYMMYNICNTKKG